ncbi:hypothetical protein B7R54_14195 [Subtercola boreus]|uniref:HTH tetR-type domain-containing protein n=1 Tax=Subtercola boreus TaxID=120213 RepID=A0A3E0VKP9_9MICO|nr:TetR/AcrR family transcriptional regulator [Subtercola boreus]RFA10229.1 hypothetical protein B7R54_14195 [Subtercola boreus]TQL52595.1 TetR family transcriptional regulator [Subtercola boreus]
MTGTEHATAAAATDPRSERSAARLREAVLRLASTRPASSISVTALVGAAGVSRKTFYNHAATPAQLLARTLTAELDEARDRAEQELTMSSADLERAVRHRLRAILSAVDARRQIYLQGGGGLSPELYQLLSDHFAAAVEQSIVALHRTPPRLRGFDDEPHRGAALAMYSSFVAHAYAGAIQSWLQHPETPEVDFLLDLIVSALPVWMLSRGAAQH